jgi:uncharacterized protein (DUF58 family)
VRSEAQPSEVDQTASAEGKPRFWNRRARSPDPNPAKPVRSEAQPSEVERKRARMRLFPTPRAIALGLAWTALALAAVPAGGLAPALALLAGGALAAAVWDALQLARLRGPTLHRVLPERAPLGRPAQVALTLSSRDDLPLRADVYEEIARDLAADDPAFRGLSLAPGASVRLCYEVFPRQRGHRPLGRVAVLLRTSLGLVQRRVMFPADRLRVVPDTSSLLPREALDPRRLLAAMGVKPVRPRGSGMEFESLREYVPGDDVRHIDWRATARRGRTITRAFRHERDHPLVLALDTSRLMGADCGRGNMLDLAVESALALAYTALHHGDRVGIAIFDSELRHFIPPRRSRRALGPLIESLCDIEPRLVEPDYTQLARELSRRQRQQALVVMLTDFANAQETAVRDPLAMLARRHRLLLVALRNPLLDEVASGADAADDLMRYRRIVSWDLLHDREVALADLRRRSVLTLDATPSDVTPPLLNRYLALRFGEG